MCMEDLGGVTLRQPNPAPYLVCCQCIPETTDAAVSATQLNDTKNQSLSTRQKSWTLGKAPSQNPPPNLPTLSPSFTELQLQHIVNSIATSKTQHPAPPRYLLTMCGPYSAAFGP